MSDLPKPTGIMKFQKAMPAMTPAEKAALVGAAKGAVGPRAMPVIPQSSQDKLAEHVAKKSATAESLSSEASGEKVGVTTAGAHKSKTTSPDKTTVSAPVKPFSLRLDANTHAALKRHIDETMASQNKIINQIVKEWLIAKGLL